MIATVSKLVDDSDDPFKGRDCAGIGGPEGEILGHDVGFRRKWLWSGGQALDIGSGGSFMETGL